MTLNEAKKILNDRHIRDGQSVIEAGTVYFKEMFGVDVQNPDRSYKSFYDVMNEVHNNIVNSQDV